MQPRQNIAKSACEILEEEVKRLFMNKSYDALKNMPAKELLTSRVVEHINSYYKLGDNDFIDFVYENDKKNLRIENPNIIYNNNEADSYIWTINFLNDYDNFCRKLPFWSLSLSIDKNNEKLFAIIVNPFLDILIFSEKGSGTVNNQRRVRSIAISDEVIVSHSKDTKIPNALSSHTVLSLNSISIEIIYLSSGLIDYYVLSHREYNNYQDCILLAKEAGVMIQKYDDYYILANEKNINKL